MSMEPEVVARKPSKEGQYSKHTQEYDLGRPRRQSYIPPNQFKSTYPQNTFFFQGKK